jgi:hypothetical protein
MGDNDFPVIMGNGGNSVGFAKTFAASMRGGKINNTWLPTTGNFYDAQQSMQDGEVSPVTGYYGEISSQPKGSTGGSTGEFDPAYLDKMKQTGSPMPPGLRQMIFGQPTEGPQTPGQSGAQQAYGFTFPTPFGGDMGDVAEAPRYIRTYPDLDSPAADRWLETQPRFTDPKSVLPGVMHNLPIMQRKYGFGGAAPV